MKITYLGHSGFIFAAGDTNVVVDPFLTGNELAKHKPADIKTGHIALTHGHEDHVGDTIEIAKANNATVYGVFELCNVLNEMGVENVERGNPAGKIETDFGYVAFTQAFHSSNYKGKYTGMPAGLVINIGGVTIYHCGDTSLFSDMKLIGEIYKPDVACVPIGDRFTMDARQGTMAAEFIGAKIAIPIHYKTFGLLAQSPDGFEPEGVDVKILDAGDELEVAG